MKSKVLIIELVDIGVSLLSILRMSIETNKCGTQSLLLSFMQPLNKLLKPFFLLILLLLMFHFNR